MRVLCLCEKWESGGIEAFVTGAYECMDRTDIEIDVAACLCDETSIFLPRLRALGIEVRTLAGGLWDVRANLRCFNELLARGSYDVVHLNLFEGLALLYARAAKRAGVARVIVHSHNTDLHPGAGRAAKLALHRACVRALGCYADERWAPSEAAARFMFRDAPWELVRNGIDPARFSFDADVRGQMRASLGLAADDVLVGCVGRLCYQKNQAFLLDVIESLGGARLMLVGTTEAGDEQDEAFLRKEVARRGLDESVVFCGASAEVSSLMQAMDVLCVPSRFEGLGIVAVEAQAAGLPTLCSPAVPPEARVCADLFASEGLDAGAWARRIRELTGMVSRTGRRNTADEVRAAGYTMVDVAVWMRAAYRGDLVGLSCGRGEVAAFDASVASEAIAPTKTVAPPGESHCRRSESEPLISVVVPIYGVEPYLGPCVESILAQTYRNLEIILVDDGSPDGCGALCDAFARKDARVSAIHRPNGGLSAARNTGLDACHGDYLAFVDGDDLVAPTFIETLLMAGADVAQCGFCTEETGLPCNLPSVLPVPARVEVPAFKSLDSHDALECLQTDATGAATVVWNKLYRRRVFEGVRFPQGKQHEDEFVTYRVLWAAETICVTKAPLYFYRQRPNSTMGAGFSVRSLDAIEALQERAAFYRAQGEKRLAVLTDATTCYRLRQMMGDIERSLPNDVAARWKHVMWECYGAVMASAQVGLRKKIALTGRMILPKAF